MKSVCKKTWGNNVLAQFEKKVPCDAFLSKSWLLFCRLSNKNLTQGENDFISQAIDYFDSHTESYEKVKQNPTVENILEHKLANCGDLADSAVKEFQKKGLAVLRANLQLLLSTEECVKKGFCHNWKVCLKKLFCSMFF